MKSIQSMKNSFLTAGSYAITHIPNCCMGKILGFFTIFKVSGRQTGENLSANGKVLAATAREKSGFLLPATLSKIRMSGRASGSVNPP